MTAGAPPGKSSAAAIVWSGRAIADLRALHACIAEFNPHAATDTGRHIAKAVENLTRFPAMGRPGRIAHTRELAISGTPFIIPYRVREGRVEIIAVLHGARRWPEGPEG